VLGEMQLDKGGAQSSSYESRWKERKCEKCGLNRAIEPESDRALDAPLYTPFHSKKLF
jgi:hypothetical protein